MRLAIRLLGPALLIAVLAVGCASTPAGAPATGAVGSGAVSIKGFAFNPAQLSVSKGAMVTWTNDDGTTHTVTSGVPGTPSGKFDQRVEAGKTFTFTFADAGTYDFFCNIHNSMKATVLVK
ncbi:MAG TPA: plastocyanin/azurin family copper-binding protein [Candidatus Limnocylindria bacterium]|jgi:plastocyanin|nr:plastocyanin/azurin family copper-binding protein [Candidatus Limnocylindria bacterium]